MVLWFWRLLYCILTTDHSCNFFTLSNKSIISLYKWREDLLPIKIFVFFSFSARSFNSTMFDSFFIFLFFNLIIRSHQRGQYAKPLRGCRSFFTDLILDNVESCQLKFYELKNQQQRNNPPLIYGFWKKHFSKILTKLSGAIRLYPIQLHIIAVSRIYIWK